MTSSALYRGSLVHIRRDHLHRTFRYPVFMAAIDLYELGVLDRDLRLFSLDRPNLFSLHARDYSTSLAVTEHARDVARANATRTDVTRTDVTRTDVTRTTLVTNLRFAGYAFNPVSFFLRYAGDDLVSVIAEVNNTYGGRHCYALDETNRIAIDARPIDTRSSDTRSVDTRSIDTRSIDARLIDTRSIDTRSIDSRPVDARSSDTARERIGFRTPREFFVSPFLHGPRVYEWWFPARRDPDRLAITMHVDTPEGDRIFTATMAGERRTLTDRALLGAAARYPLNTAQVIGLIHFEALKLRFLHDQPYRRPGPDHRPLDL